jgi:hypothetical protein
MDWDAGLVPKYTSESVAVAHGFSSRVNERPALTIGDQILLRQPKLVEKPLLKNWPSRLCRSASRDGDRDLPT